MQFLRQKIVRIYEKSIKLGKTHHSESSLLLKSIFSRAQSQIQEQLLEKLSNLSVQEKQYLQIFRILLQKLEKMNYKLQAIKSVLKAISIATYLIKYGTSKFSIDFLKHQDILEKLENIDTHYYDRQYTSDKKKLQYHLQMLRQRAIFFRKLIKTPDLLLSERAKTLSQRQDRKTQFRSQTSTNLMISQSFSQSSQKNFKIAFKKQDQPKQKQSERNQPFQNQKIYIKKQKP